MPSKDDRFFVRVALDLPSNPKLVDASAAAKWLNVCGYIVSRRDLTDGVIRPSVALAEADVTAKNARELVGRGVWHEPGHECDRCPQPPRGMVVIHDYLEHQQSREEVAETRRAKSEAGKRGAAARWGGTNGTRHATSHSSSHGTPHEDRMWQTDSRVEQSREDPSVQSVSYLPQGGPQPVSDGLDLDKIKAETRGTTQHAIATAQLILHRAPSEPRNATAYVLAAIRRDPEAFRYRRGNPKRGEECPMHAGQWADRCAGCAADRLAVDAG